MNRKRWFVVIGVLLITLLVHAGIAMALDGRVETRVRTKTAPAAAGSGTGYEDFSAEACPAAEGLDETEDGAPVNAEEALKKLA